MYCAGGMILSFLTAGTLFTLSSCADDHFNISNDVTGTKTIWENIKENKDLSDYAYIIEHVPYSQKENGFTKQTYADILSGNQTFTIWAPTNGSFDFESYKKLIDTGNTDDLKRIERELIRNNMTRYTHVMNGQEQEKLILFNGKRGILDYTNNTFKGQSIIRPNIASSNGVLHVTQAPAEFEPNVYEYLFNVDGASEMQKFLKKYEIEVFNEAGSIPGPTVNGEATWVDSMTYKFNEYLGQYLEREDSNYAVIIPTDNAWKQVYDKIGTYFNYRSKYIQDVHTKTENGSDTTITGKETTFKSEELDSIRHLYISNSILKGTYFNANWQPRQISIVSLKDIAKADSLVSAKEIQGEYKFKKLGTLNATNDKRNTHESADFVSMFGGNEPVKCSNGYAYTTDTWNFPSSLYAPTLEYKAAQVFEYANKGTNTTGSKSFTIESSSENGKDSIVTYEYVALTGPSNSNFQMYFNLPNIQSGKYDIYMVTLHNSEYNCPTMFKANLYLHDKNDKMTTTNSATALINECQGGLDSYGEPTSKKNDFYTHQYKNDTISTDPLVIKPGSYTDTICIAKDKEIPYSYYGLYPDAYPILYIQGSPSYSDVNTQKYCRQLLVVSFILKPKRDE